MINLEKAMKIPTAEEFDQARIKQNQANLLILNGIIAEVDHSSPDKTIELEKTEIIVDRYRSFMGAVNGSVKKIIKLRIEIF